MKPIHSLTGLVAATHTPFKSDGSLNLAVVETQAARLLAAGVSAAFINGTTGECLSLSLEERRTLAQRWFEVARGTDLKISVHVGSNCLPDARALATQAEQLGATRSPRLPRATSSRGTSTRSLRGAPTSPPPRRSTRCDAAANPGQPPFPDVKDMTQPKSETTRPVKRTLTLLATLLLAPLAALHAADKPSLLPANWDPAQSGNRVMEGLVRITAPHVKGAHDAQFVCVGKHAYIVSTDNDVQPGHSAGEREYCVLSAVNLRTLTVEQIVPLAKSEQAFANVTLPKGMCFVPRILHIAEDTLRCYFASQPSDQEAVTWFRDFDMRTRQFEPSIHKAKLKTAAGTFDMEPRHFHADAVAQGFTKPPVNQGLYIFDSFKEFDGRRYVALNNFPGKQNALAVLHDDFATFEVIGHYNEPQSQQLSESAVNRLPDGTWMAIVRNDAGNYHFTTSQDGKTWSIAEPKPFVPNGLNSKPTFDKFGGVYYLGWQSCKLPPVAK